MSGGGSDDYCAAEIERHEEAIFVGFCVPGEYTLRVNSFTKTFFVRSDSDSDTDYGYDLDDISVHDMHIESVDIIVAETHKEVSDLTGHSNVSLFSVTVWVIGVAGSNLCYGHYETDYLRREDYAGHPLYRNGDTLNIHISAYELKDPIIVACPDEVSMHEEAIFVGFCVPGEYTLRVNDFTKTFRVGSDL